MKIAVLKETVTGETRLAVTPKTAQAYHEAGCRLVLQTGSGLAAGWPDTAYQAVGAKIVSTPAEALKEADLCLKIQPPTLKELDLLSSGKAFVSLLMPHENKALLKRSIEKKIDLFSLSLIPRISRAQSMDVLSSQANLSGYRAVIEAANAYQGLFPMLMTAAGAIAPAKVFVMGVGVAGLQAIATARRLGAVVSATDVRPATQEQVASLGARFIAVEDEEFREAETQGGHAKPMSKAYQEKQAELIKTHIKDQDIIITTALIPGKKAPILITRSMLGEMKYGAIAIDLAIAQGGNVYGAKPDCEVLVEGVRILGFSNLPARTAQEASSLFANNVLKYFALLHDGKGVYAPHDEDEIIKATQITRAGKQVCSQDLCI